MPYWASPRVIIASEWICCIWLLMPAGSSGYTTPRWHLSTGANDERKFSWHRFFTGLKPFFFSGRTPKKNTHPAEKEGRTELRYVYMSNELYQPFFHFFIVFFSLFYLSLFLLDSFPSSRALHYVIRFGIPVFTRTGEARSNDKD